MQIKKLPEKLQKILTADDVVMLTNLDLLKCSDYEKFGDWLQSKNVEEDRIELAEKQKLERQNWATLAEIAVELDLTMLSLRRAIFLCFFTQKKKPLSDYSEVTMIQNMDFNLKAWEEKGKKVFRPETEQKMRKFAKKYYYSPTKNRWYFRIPPNV